MTISYQWRSEPSLARLPVAVVGRYALLTHNPEQMLSQQRGGKGKPEIPSPEDEAKAGLYLLNGICHIPGIAFRNAIVNAASKHRAPRGRGSIASYVAHILVEPELVPILNPDTWLPYTATGYTPYSQRAVVQKQGIIRTRPRFDKWAAEFEIVYEPALVNDYTLLNILDDAGQRIGVGDYRMARSGPFGRFGVVWLQGK